MSTPKPMSTPNLADLLAKKPPASSTSRTPIPAGPLLEPGPTEAKLQVTRTATADSPATPESTSAIVKDAGGARGVELGDQREYLRSIALYLPRTLHQQLGQVARERETTRTALILEAINSTHGRLGSALEPTFTPAGRQDLFSVPQSKTNSEPSVQTTIRVTDAQHAAIATLVSENHTNRSRLVSAALDLYLGK